MNRPRKQPLLMIVADRKQWQKLLIMVLLVSSSGACKVTEPEPLPDRDPNATITLDELIDMENYTEGMIVDARLYGEERVHRVILNDTETEKPVSLDLSSPGYYRLEIYYGDSHDRSPEIIRLVVLDQVRQETEWGLPPWTPRGVELQSLGAREARLIHPGRVPGGKAFPVVILVEGELTRSMDNFTARTGTSTFLVKRGVGSTWLVEGDPLNGTIELDQESLPLSFSVFDTTARVLGGTLEGDLHLEPGTYATIREDLYIPAGMTLRIDSGAFVTVDPAVNIYNEGVVSITGSGTHPVVITCSDEESYWGGFLSTAPGSRFEVSHAILARSGYHTGSGYDWGHAHRQALFYSDQGSISLEHCYMIDHIGQAIYTESADLDMDYCLVQRVKTGGQQNGSRVNIHRCVFTDFPDDSDVYRDQDNDALYLVECVAEITHTIFMYAKDDGLDSGSGAYPGDVTVRNCRFESIFHEGAALSGGSGEAKIQRFYNCLFQDCGQGLELGFSSKTHQVIVDSCTFLRNGIGIRYGDNYPWSVNGYIKVSRSSSLENTVYDVWNMIREFWAADTFQMEFDQVLVSRYCPMYPQLMVVE